MNYRHAFHAGNHADVFKHATLLRLAALLARKETPFAYLDSHSGVGRYDLAGDQASRTDEWREGIGRLWALESAPAAFVGYREAVAALNPDGALRYYPGSPELMRQALRPQDRLLLNELHPEDGRLLKENMARDRRVAVHQKDGWLLPRALLPVPERRALLLIDPPFEKADELERCVKAVAEAIGRMRQTVIMLWYPIKDRRQLRRFHAGLQASGAPKLLNVELLIRAADDATRLNGSGLAIVNPPWGLEEELRDLLPWLAEHLAQGEGSWRLDWLIAE
ncbi:23S rRNA (adenine2030-N6)-methyltransferase [Pseudomonas sp. SORGH_AS199]|uniref:23S rRNA (adenine(2030)-N(6))-methyltransferase RlmJ n=1 Tax=Pseudomonas TaxID=286 RepID=UPI00165E8B4D|nr:MULTISPECIES: 23S rRNA (adenine(2030)-N(6))-methyltransferase RlmJ [Pseudomonas]MDR6229067.1 23S rRNA (adenine2030-N6)-methyltransferase [Pseudomonas sp. SORGH_AS_0199]QNQ98303.1 23S rRNA (adenine(2030)-N(6))-methyltransferase RlmJ [Pseudomonas psychrotolerans]